MISDGALFRRTTEPPSPFGSIGTRQSPTDAYRFFRDAASPRMLKFCPARAPQEAPGGSVDAPVALADLRRVRAFEERDLGSLHAHVAVEEVPREPGAHHLVPF